METSTPISLANKETAIKLIPALDTSLIDYVRKKIEEKLRKHVKPVGTYKGANVYKFGDSENGYVILVEDSEVIYFVKYKRISFNGTRHARQVLVWRNNTAFPAIGFADFVFFQRLLPTFKSLVSDQLQTEGGKKFWQFAVNKAIDQGLYVYLYDRSIRPNTLILLPTFNDAKVHTKTLWGQTERDKYRLLIISLIPLKLRDSK